MATNRPCPAKGDRISPADCGAQRGSKLACPPHCPYYPFGTEAYDSWLKVDGEWIRKVANYLHQKISSGGMGELIHKFRLRAEDPDSDVESAFYGAVYYGLMRRRGPDGRTIAETWETEGWIGLNNDERVMMLYRRRSFVTIIEIQRILSDKALKCIDLLRPGEGPFTLFDRLTAANAVRFDRILVWLTHYPHFSRIGGIGIPIPELLAERAIEAIRAIAQEHLNASYNIHDYLADNFVGTAELLWEMQREHMVSMFRRTDVSHAVATYRLQASLHEVQAVLESKPEFQLADDPKIAPDKQLVAAYVWLRKGESKEIEKALPEPFRHDHEDAGVGTLGEVKLFADRLVIETFSQLKQTFAKKMIDRYLGKRVAFEKESITDVARQMADRIESEENNNARIWHHAEHDPIAEAGQTIAAEEEPKVLIPKEARQQLMGRFFRSHYEKFLIDPVPALGGISPVEAAQDPLLRPRLVELMKNHIHGLARTARRDGLELNIDWVIDRLGLDELK